MSNDTSRTMRAKVKVGAVTPYPNASGEVTQEILHFHGVAATKYPADGSDEDNTFAKFSPSLNLQLHLANPALIGRFKPGDTFYIDFTPAPG